MEADPIDAVDFAKLGQQSLEALAVFPLHSVFGEILGDEVQLAHATLGHLAGFGDEGFDRAGADVSAELRNDAERAAAITAFRQFQETRVSWAGVHARIVFGVDERGLVDVRALRKRSAHLTALPCAFKSSVMR